jgi:hypothetical protein
VRRAHYASKTPIPNSKPLFSVWGVLCFPEWRPNILNLFTAIPTAIDVNNASSSAVLLQKILYICEAVASSFDKFYSLRERSEVTQLFDSLRTLQKIRKITIFIAPTSDADEPQEPRDEDVEKDKEKDEFASQKLELEKCRALIDNIFKLSKELKGVMEDQEDGGSGSVGGKTD